MTKIALIGAGSLVFTRNLCSDILLTPVLQDCTISLMDIDAGRLSRSREVVQALVDGRKLAARVEATTDRREAVRDADYVVTTFQQGGLEAYGLDIEIPRRYGVEQCVGDTLGPGGVFRALRTIPVLLDLCDDMDELAPDALLLNYVNPMAANCWAVDLSDGPPARGPVPQRAGNERVDRRLGRRALRRGDLPLCRHQPSGLLPGVPPWRGGPLPGDPGGRREGGDLRHGTRADRAHEALRLLRYRVQRSRERVRPVLPQERADGRGGIGAALHRTRKTRGSTSGARAATCATA